MRLDAAARPPRGLLPPISDLPLEERTACPLVERLSATCYGRQVVAAGRLVPTPFTPTGQGPQVVALYARTYALDGRRRSVGRYVHLACAVVGALVAALGWRSVA